MERRYWGLQPVTAVSSGSLLVRNNCSFPCPHSTGTLGTTGLPVRFGIGRFNTAAEIDKVAQHAITTIHSLRAVSSVFL